MSQAIMIPLRTILMVYVSYSVFLTWLGLTVLHKKHPLGPVGTIIVTLVFILSWPIAVPLAISGDLFKKEDDDESDIGE